MHGPFPLSPFLFPLPPAPCTTLPLHPHFLPSALHSRPPTSTGASSRCPHHVHLEKGAAQLAEGHECVCLVPTLVPPHSHPLNCTCNPGPTPVMLPCPWHAHLPPHMA